MKKKLRDYLFFILFRVRPFTRRVGELVAQSARDGQKILEIGSGKKTSDGMYYFSMEPYFSQKKVTFIKSDVNPAHGHRVINVVTFEEQEQYDHILCFHVLDDVYEWEAAFLNLYRALKKEGVLHLVFPVFNGWDYGADYYRFSERLLKNFCQKQHMHISHFETHGHPYFPFAYYLQVKKI